MYFNFLRFLTSLFLVLITGAPSYSQQPITQDEFKKELISAYDSNNNILADSVVRNNRFLVKPFVNAAISEIIRMELQGRIKQSKQLQVAASQTAKNFHRIFGEKSLVIAVNYLASWTKDQKKCKLIADSLYASGTRYRLDNENEKALQALEVSLEKYREITDERGEAEALGGLGALYFNNFEDYRKAFELYSEALVKREKVDDKQLMGNTLNSIGAVYTKYFEDYPRALEYYEKAEALRSEIGDKTGLRSVMVNKAEAYKLLGEKLNSSASFTESIGMLEKSYRINNSLKDKAQTAEVLSLMGFVYSKTGDFKTSMEKLTQAEKMAREAEDSIALAGVYNHFGIVLQNSGRLEKALDYYNIVLKTYERENDLRNEIPVLDNLGTIYSDLRQYDKAEEYFKRGLKICTDLNDRVKETDYLLNLANNQIFQGKLTESRSNYRKALGMAKSIGNTELIWKIQAGLAENWAQSGDLAKAVGLNDSALTIIEGLRSSLKSDELRASYMANERYVYEDLIDMLETLFEKSRTESYNALAYSYAERCKSRVLLDLLTGTNENKVMAEMNKGDGKEAAEVISLKEAMSICPDKKTVILEYITGDSSSYLWAISKADARVFRLPAITKLKEQIETIRFAMLDPDQPVTKFFTDAGCVLYDELIKPAESFLPKSARLVVIPDGILNYLPFEVLLTEKGTKANKNSTSYNDLPFLVRKYSINYVQSASILKNILIENSSGSSDQEEKKNLIAFGDPVYSDSSGFNGKALERLEFSGEEVRNIASSFGKGAADLFLRDEATEDNVKREDALSSYNYIHFATHGLINETEPDLSALALTRIKGSKDDGLLTASEISGLKLRADLVVLSACETGLGKLLRGEGMIGMTRAFMNAGASSVLVSLWSVSDRSTATLMSNFYKGMIKGSLTRTDALRKAQLTLISDKKYSHPFYWAPFVLIGDWR